jgi:glutathione S-transferase
VLNVWGRRSSFNVQKVFWLLGELELAHAHVPAGGSFGRLPVAQLRREPERRSGPRRRDQQNARLFKVG